MIFHDMKKTLLLILGSLLVMGVVLGCAVYFTYKAVAPLMTQWSADSSGLNFSGEFQPFDELPETIDEGRERPLATLEITQGTGVSVQYAGSEAKVEAESDMALSQGDTIMTDGQSMAAIHWSGYGRTLLSTSTTLTLTEAGRPDAEGIAAKLRLTSGRVWTRLEQVLNPGSNFEVRAANVVATVRGTSFGVGLTIPGKVRVQVMESNVSVGRTASEASDEIIGPLVNISAEQEMLADMKETALPKPASMSEEDLADPFMLEGNAEIDLDPFANLPFTPDWFDGGQLPTEQELDYWYAILQPYMSELSAEERADIDRSFAELRAQIRAQQ